MGEHEILHIRYKYREKVITTKERFPNVQNFLDWSKLHGKPFEKYTKVELVK